MSFGGWHIPDHIPDHIPSKEEIEAAARALKEHEAEIKRELEKHSEEVKRDAEIAKDALPFEFVGSPPSDSQLATFRTEQVDELLGALIKLPAFNPLSHIDHLKFHINVGKNNYKNVVKADLYGENLDPHRLDLWSRKQGDLERFKFMTIALGLRSHPEHNFTNAIGTDFDAKYNSSCDDIAMICYRHDLDNFVNEHTSKKLSSFDPQSYNYLKMTGLETHVADEDFCRAYAKKVTRPEFVNLVLLQQFVAGGGDTKFAAAVAYIYERCRPTLAKLPETHKVPDDSIKAAQATTSYNSLAKFTAQAHWQDAAAKHDGLKDNAITLARFATASKPVTWLNEYKLQGPCWRDLGQVLGREWSLQGDWSQQVGQSLSAYESYPASGAHGINSRWYGSELMMYLIKGGEVLGPNNSDLFNISSNAGWEYQSIPIWGSHGDGFDNNVVAMAVTSNMHQAKKPHDHHHVYPSSRLMTRTQFDTAWRPSVSLHEGMSVWSLDGDSHHQLPSVKLHQGKVLVNDQFCKHAEVQGSQIHWAREITEDTNHSHEWEHGTVVFDPQQLTACGTVGLGTKDSVITTMAVATTIEPVNFSLQVEPADKAHDKIEDALAAVGTSANDMWDHFWDMQLMAEFDPGGAVTGTFAFPDIAGRDNKKFDDVEGIDLYSSPQVAIDRSDAGSWKWNLECESSLMDLFDGFVTKYTADDSLKAKAGPSFAKFVVKVNSFGGETVGYVQQIQKAIDGTCTGGKYRAIRGGWAPSNVLAMVRTSALHSTFTTNLNHIAIPTATRSMVHAMFIDTRSVIGLSSLGSDITSEAIQDKSLRYLMRSAEYHRGTKEVELFGSRKTNNAPLLPDSLKDNLADDCKTWLADYMGKATLLNAAVHSEEKYANLLTKEDEDKIKFWWDGGAKKCLALSPEYTSMMELAFSTAYEDLVPAAKGYKNDTKDWATEFYNALAAPNQIKMLDLDILISGNKNRLNQYSLLLNYLDKEKKDYAKKLYELILQQQIMKLTQGSGTLNDKWPSFIVDFWAKLIDELKKTTDEDNKALRILILEIEVDQTKAANDNVQHSAGKLLMENQELARLVGMITSNMMIARRMSRADVNGTDYAKALAELDEAVRKSDKIKAWLEVKLPHIKVFTSFVMQGFTLAQSCFYMAKWEKLDGSQRAVAVANLVEAVMKTFKELGSLIATFRDPLNSKAIRLECIKRWQKLGGNKPNVTITDGHGTNQETLPAEKIAEPANTNRPASQEEGIQLQILPTTQDEAITENLIKEFDLANVVAEGVSIACNIVVIICMSMDINEEIKNGSQSAGIVAMDIISVTVMSLQSVLGIAAIGMEVMGIELVMMPYAAAGLAVVSGVMMLVEMLVERDPPPPGPDKIKLYIENERDKGFVKNIPERPKPKLTYGFKQESIKRSWKDTTEKEVEHEALKITITIQDLGSLKPHINNWQVHFMAGDGASCAFADPVLYKAHKDKDNKDVPSAVYQGFITSCTDATFVWAGAERAGSDKSVVKMLKPAKITFDAKNDVSYPQFEKEIVLELVGVKNDKYVGSGDQVSNLQIYEILGKPDDDGPGAMDRKVQWQIKK